ncbi:hypothetical protein KKF61_07500 [Patescibacteria group bacterium]|nr:hypothetical protein [Patescibacteria group bacterium]
MKKTLAIVGGLAILALLGGCSAELTDEPISLNLNGDITINVPNQDLGMAIPSSINQASVVVDTGTGQALARPSGISIATSSGGALGDDTYYFKLTSIDSAGGETMPTDEILCNIGLATYGTASSCTITLTAITDAASHRVYMSTSSQSYSYGYKTATATTVIVNDTLTAGAIPTENTAFHFNSGAGVAGSFLQKYCVADCLVRTGETFVHTITYSPTDAAATAGTVAILDAVAAGNNATTTLIYFPAAAFEAVTITLDQVFDTGVYVDFTTTADVNVSISYK